MSWMTVSCVLIVALTTVATSNAFIVPATRFVSQSSRTVRSSRIVGSHRPLYSSSSPINTEHENDVLDDDEITPMIEDNFKSFDPTGFKNKLASQIDIFDPFNFQQRNVQDLPESTLQQPLVPQEEENKGQIGIWAARALLLVVAMLWGTNFAAVKYLETLCFHPPCSHLPSEAALARFGVAAIVSLPLLINQRKDVILAGAECGFWITFGYITQAMALETIGAGKCAFICSLTVVVVPLLSALFFGKKIKPVHLASAAVALSGVGVLEGLVDVNFLLGIQPAVAETVSSMVPHAALSATGETTGWLASAASALGVGKGDIIALGQPVGFGLAFMRIEHYVEKFKDVENRILTISAAQCVVVGFLALLWVLHDFHGTFPSFAYMMEPHRLAAVGWTGIMTTVVAIYMEGVALQTASATEAALTFSSEPVWASLFGAWLLHEKLNSNSYVGGAVILIACIMGALADLPQSTDITSVETKEME